MRNCAFVTDIKEKTKIFLLLLCLATSLHAAERAKPAIYIEPQEGFETYLAAAMDKKHVQADVVVDREKAVYVLKTSSVTTNKESTGGKIARCLFLYCAGIEDRGNVSVQLIETNSSKVVWAYAVNKQRGHKNEQSMAEAVAKHLNEYFQSGHVTQPAVPPTTADNVSSVAVPHNTFGTSQSEPPRTLKIASVGPSTTTTQLQNSQDKSDEESLAPSAKKGSVSITSTPDGAEIFVDSVGAGSTPAILKLAPGPHSVQVTKAGYKDSVSDVMIEPDGILNLTLTLER